MYKYATIYSSCMLKKAYYDEELERQNYATAGGLAGSLISNIDYPFEKLTDNWRRDALKYKNSIPKNPYQPHAVKAMPSLADLRSVSKTDVFKYLYNNPTHPDPYTDTANFLGEWDQSKADFYKQIADKNKMRLDGIKAYKAAKSLKTAIRKPLFANILSNSAVIGEFRPRLVRTSIGSGLGVLAGIGINHLKDKFTSDKYQ